jgi:regulatory protein YycI of two-component signal transduction system YycFG
MIDINMIIIFITIFIVINVVLLLVLLAKKVYFLKKQVNENRYINYFINNY